MPRAPRVNVGNEIYHIINRANARLPIFFKEQDYLLFEYILMEAKEKFNMRILAYCLMPNHFHLVLHPKNDNDLQKFMQWVTLTHTQRWHRQNNTVGTGHLYQGRYKSFLIEKDKHLLAVVRYVERNPLRAKLVKKAENWNFSSLTIRISKNPSRLKLLSEWPISEPENYISFVNTFMTEDEESNIRCSVNRGNPFGSDHWMDEIISKFKLLSTIMNRGRQIKGT